MTAAALALLLLDELDDGWQLLLLRLLICHLCCYRFIMSIIMALVSIRVMTLINAIIVQHNKIFRYLCRAIGLVLGM